MATQEEPPPAAVDAVRLELRTLAEASDRTVPELVVEQQNRLPRVDGRGRVVVPASLLPKGRARWRWYLASCLGRLGSPVPRRRQRIGWALFAVFGLVYLALLVRYPGQTWVWLTIALLYPLSAWTARWERQAMEDAGRGILAAAGHDPAAIAREAFGGEREPSAWQHLLAFEPSPQERIEAAGRSHP